MKIFRNKNKKKLLSTSLILLFLSSLPLIYVMTQQNPESDSIPESEEKIQGKPEQEGTIHSLTPEERPDEEDGPLSEEEKQRFDFMLAEHKIKRDTALNKFILGEVEVQQFFNRSVQWTKKTVKMSTLDGVLYALPKSSLKFMDTNSKELIAEIHFNEFNPVSSGCEERFILANIDLATPWPELLYTCDSPYRGASDNTLVFLVTHDKRILVNTDIGLAEPNFLISGKTEIQAKQNLPEFEGEFRHEFNAVINRRNGEHMRPTDNPWTPSIFMLALLNPISLWKCSACSLYSHVALIMENGIWKYAHTLPGSKAFFENSINELDRNYREAQVDPHSNFAINEYLFAKVAYSIRVGRGKQEWKKLLKQFDEVGFESCNGEEACLMTPLSSEKLKKTYRLLHPCISQPECPFPSWQDEIRRELQRKGFPIDALH